MVNKGSPEGIQNMSPFHDNQLKKCNSNNPVLLRTLESSLQVVTKLISQSKSIYCFTKWPYRNFDKVRRN